MEHSYNRMGMNNYLIIPCAENSVEDYQMQIMQHNELKTFLFYTLQKFDGQNAYCYGINSKKNLTNVLGRTELDYEKAYQIMKGVVEALQEAEHYLLDEEAIVLDPDFIFMDPSQFILKFCYVPEYEHNIRTQIKDLVQWLMKQANRKDERCMIFIYGLYDIMTEENVCIGDLENYLTEKKETKYVEDEELQYNQCVQDYDEIKNEADVRNKILHVAVIILGIGNLIFMAGLFMEIFSYHYAKYLIMSMGVLIIATIMLIKISPKETEEDIMREYFERVKENAKLKEEPPKLQEELTGIQKAITRLQEEISEETTLLSSRDLFVLYPVMQNTYAPIYLEESGLIIGSMEQETHYVLKEKGVSRMHAKIIKKGKNVYLLDLNSTNGTYINGARINSSEECLIEKGDLVAFATCEFYAG